MTVAIKTCPECSQPISDNNTFTAAGWQIVTAGGPCEKCFNTVMLETEEEEE